MFDQSAVHSEHLAYVGGGDGSMLLDHEVVFVSNIVDHSIDAMAVNVCCSSMGTSIIALINDETWSLLQFKLVNS